MKYFSDDNGSLFFLPKLRTIEVILATVLATLRTKSTNLLKPVMLIFLVFARVHVIIIWIS